MTINATVAIVAVALVVVGCSGTSGKPSPTPATLPAAAHVSAPEPTTEPPPGPPSRHAFYDGGTQADTAYAQLLEAGRDDDAALVKRIADEPTATWLGDWLGVDAARDTARAITTDAHELEQIAVLVIYAIPGRDCGLHSAGGLPEQHYLDFVRAIADGISAGGGETWIVLEPDALAQLGDCDGQGDRVALLAGAAEVLDNAGASVFIDVGNSNWLAVDEAAARIGRVGTVHLTGFATNTSNYNSTADERAWGSQIAERTGLPFVVDTSRNGNGSDGQWCNPRGRALGEPPAVIDEGPLLATLWVKAPGESDGTCNGGPDAGQWWLDVALELARNA